MQKALKTVRYFFLSFPWPIPLRRGDEWKRVPETIKRELEVTSKDDGEFWMSFSDFRREYSNMIICNMSPDFDHDGISDKAGKSALKKRNGKVGLRVDGKKTKTWEWLELINFFFFFFFFKLSHAIHSNLQIEIQFSKSEKKIIIINYFLRLSLLLLSL